MDTSRAYELAREQYASIGVDTEEALRRLSRIPISMHCWQGDDVTGFENPDAVLSGGLAATGNYPGKARNAAELRADIAKALELIPGKKKIAIHAKYWESPKFVERDQIEPRHFDGWIDWAKQHGVGMDFNPTYFSHPKSDDGFTLSHPGPAVRRFWIEHGIRSRIVSEYIGRKLGQRCVNNIWIPDGMKDNVYDKTAPRQRLIEALDEMLAKPLDPACTADALESKLFGIGSESYVTGSHEFYMGYVMRRPELLLTLDAGHFHPTESISGKIPTLLLFVKELLLHVSRSVRWDSDHVVILDDELTNIAQEIIRGGYEDRVNIALDYFDASINRIAAWVIGMRATQKALLRACLEPAQRLKEYEHALDFTSRLALTEEYKSYPFGAVWDHYCEISSVPPRESWMSDMRRYESDVTDKRR